MAGLAEMAATTNLVAATPTFAAMDAPTTTRDSLSGCREVDVYGLNHRLELVPPVADGGRDTSAP